MLTLASGLRFTQEKKTIKGQFDEQGPGIDGLEQDPTKWPNINSALLGLQEIGTALAQGDFPSQSSLNAIAPSNKRVGVTSFRLSCRNAPPRFE